MTDEPADPYYTDDPRPICAVTETEHCHLQGVRYNAKPCMGSCDLAEETR